MVVYGLIDPRSGELRYVGKTKGDAARRLSGHITEARRGTGRHVYNWLRQLLAADLKPEVEVLETCASAADLDEAERHHIAYWRAIGANLTNLTAGGEGLLASAEVRDKLARAARRQWALSRSTMLASLRGKSKSHRAASYGAKAVVDERGAIYPSASRAALQLGLDVRAVSRSARRGWSVRGHTFRYLG